jgi:hypothetical protein
MWVVRPVTASTGVTARVSNLTCVPQGDTTSYTFRLDVENSRDQTIYAALWLRDMEDGRLLEFSDFDNATHLVAYRDKDGYVTSQQSLIPPYDATYWPTIELIVPTSVLPSGNYTFYPEILVFAADGELVYKAAFRECLVKLVSGSDEEEGGNHAPPTPFPTPTRFPTPTPFPTRTPSPTPASSGGDDSDGASDECEVATLSEKDWVAVFTRGDTVIYVRQGSIWLGPDRVPSSVPTVEVWINGVYQYEEPMPWVIADGIETIVEPGFVYRPGSDGRLQPVIEILRRVRFCGWSRESVRASQLDLEYPS